MSHAANHSRLARRGTWLVVLSVLLAAVLSVAVLFSAAAGAYSDPVQNKTVKVSEGQTVTVDAEFTSDWHNSTDSTNESTAVEINVTEKSSGDLLYNSTLSVNETEYDGLGENETVWKTDEISASDNLNLSSETELNVSISAQNSTAVNQTEINVSENSGGGGGGMLSGGLLGSLTLGQLIFGAGVLSILGVVAARVGVGQ